MGLSLQTFRCAGHYPSLRLQACIMGLSLQTFRCAVHFPLLHLQAYITGLSLYTSPSFTGQPLFSITLNAVGEEIRCGAGAQR